MERTTYALPGYEATILGRQEGYVASDIVGLTNATEGAGLGPL